MIITQTFTMARWQIVVRKSEATKQRQKQKQKQTNKKEKKTKNNNIVDGAITNLLSVLRIWIEILSCAHGNGGGVTVVVVEP